MRTQSLIGRSLLLLAVLVFAHSAPTYAKSFGTENAGTTPSSGMSADYKRGSRFTLTEAGVLSELCLYVDGNGGATGTQDLRFVIYRDNDGVPGDIVLGHDQLARIVVTQGDAPSWQCRYATYLPLTPGNYWLAIHSGGTPGVARYYYDNSAANWYGGADTFDDGASRVFGSGGAGSGVISINARYGPGTLPTVGTVTPTGNPSGPMSADYKRGSSFVLPEAGQITSVSAYLDGNGGAQGEQRIRVAIYRDDNGVPRELVALSDERTIYSGMFASWTTFYITSDALQAGRYWVALHTAGTPGVIRYYLAGTGNWYGNADPYADGSSTLFGPGGPGNGTISAWMVYERGTGTPRQFGRSDIAATPSSGMTANMIRGSSFYTGEYLGFTGVATALYAYMDGRGGGAGSQQVRMVMYYDPEYDDLNYYAIPSDVVTIPAGAPPGWVRFPIPPTYVSNGGYQLALHSGQNTGVARYYIDGSYTNWGGGPDDFADGPMEVYEPPQFGLGTISTYIQYTEFNPQ
jgi:hypothetical protein